MPDTYDLILKGGTVVNQDGEGLRDIGIAGGKITSLGHLGRASAGEVIDCAGLHVLPGVIDTQVHFREPGLTHKEDLETGSRSAVMGGVTAVFEMPNTNPTTTSGAALADKIASARHRMHCDFAFFIGGTRENTNELPDLERLPGCAGVKVFIGSSTGALLVEDDDTLRRVLGVIRRRASFHSEDEFRLRARPASAYMFCTSPPSRRWRFSKATKTSRRSRSRRTISPSKRQTVTSGSARMPR
jgi:dihydroorotase